MRIALRWESVPSVLLNMDGDVMKRFLIFAWDTYYPVGGSGDTIGSTDTLIAALSVCKGKKPSYDYFQILDMEERKWINDIPE